MTIQIIGTFLSPFVRKVLSCLYIKSLPYQIDPLIPFFGNKKFESFSPLRTVPILIDNGFTITDSSVICQYLEDKYPIPSIYPSNIEDRAKARWIEEFADTIMADAFVWKLYNELIVKKSVWKVPINQEKVEKAKNVDIPKVLDILENNIIKNSDEFLFKTNGEKNEISIADISLASIFRNVEFTKYSIDVNKWPKCSNYLKMVLSHNAFLKMRNYEELCLRTNIPLQRETLIKNGAPINNLDLASEKPIKGVLNKSGSNL